MEQIAQAGILTGISMMPILPWLCDTDENLGDRALDSEPRRQVRACRRPDAGRPAARDYFFRILRQRFPDLVPLYERLYPVGSYGAVRSGDAHSIGRRVRELCRQYGISDRMPRPIIPGDKRALNKRIVEALANECYWIDLCGESQQRVWAYRKAGWAIEDLEQDEGLIYRQLGRNSHTAWFVSGSRSSVAGESASTMVLSSSFSQGCRTALVQLATPLTRTCPVLG